MSSVLFAGCAGENLFSLAASVGEVGPEVSINAPSEAFTLAIGDSILVTADVNAPAGTGSATFRGNYVTGGAPAFVAETQTLSGAAVANLSNYLRAADGQVTGSVYIVIEVTDLGGDVGKDSVKVTIG
ncbi:MAG: hypothetical protein O2958_08730 [Gemmatimonadetes bacterium]|nr:hypothetical protein [Gemmatimonadota bacterium]MDA1103759.1 hypothetical protein [Gemmatimonadota bacterium]